ncbi:helix-turn-helix transcriptional regulator [Bifidobacterium sp. ESL0790]|uniref:helix-turn-helix domain-containing protein n=1 Tax=Bifidobacterium sp. ESL0790 TaxID=2983233 RepID=UPI0023F8A92F|nr:helix-turn-helix transcriptional regulator [Bifidobacterium sp. ESL0790]WEV73115.1 helix-turn-helix transcriptional regulator [Bifidobacterium sp. ESL0790]
MTLNRQSDSASGSPGQDSSPDQSSPINETGNDITNETVSDTGNLDPSALTYDQKVALAQRQHTTIDAITNPAPAELKTKEPRGSIMLELDKVMVDRHMSLKELADEVGISNVNLSKIKNNRVAAIRFSTLAGICEALECQPGDILKYQTENEDD